jgi:ATP-dependent protease Clp ATPase subunit
MQQHKNTILMKILAQLKQLKNTQLKHIMQQHKNAIFSSKKKILRWR